MKMINRALFFVTISACIAVSLAAVNRAQSVTESRKVEEPILIGGKPALRYYGYKGEKSTVTYVYYRLFRNKAFAIPIQHYYDTHLNWKPIYTESGFLYISKDRIAFVPNEDQVQLFAFDIPKTEVKTVQVKTFTSKNYAKGVLLFSIDLEIPGIKGKFWARNDKEEGVGSTQVPSMSLNEFIVQAIRDFDAALNNFEKQTASLPKALEEPVSSTGATPTQLTVAAPVLPDFTKGLPPATPNERQSLYEQFYNNRKLDPDAAYTAAKAFARQFPEDPETAFVRKWILAYENVRKREQ